MKEYQPGEILIVTSIPDYEEHIRSGDKIYVIAQSIDSYGWYSIYNQTTRQRCFINFSKYTFKKPNIFRKIIWRLYEIAIS